MAKARSLLYLDAHIPNRENAVLLIQARLTELYSWEAYLDNPANVKELHNLRIAAKRLRYSLEIFEDVLPPTSVALREEMEQVQEELGAVHDSDVLDSLLQLCLSPGASALGEQEASGLAALSVLHQKGLTLSQSLLNRLLDPRTLPDEEEQRGLELLRTEVINERERQYRKFVKHWHKLKKQAYEQNMQRMLADTIGELLASETEKAVEKGGALP